MRVALLQKTQRLQQHLHTRHRTAGGLCGRYRRSIDGLQLHRALAGVDFQRHWESQAFLAGGSNYDAPAQRVGDFLAGRPSTVLGQVDPSYQPGVHMTDLSSCAPAFVIDALREAIPAFDRQIHGFAMADAVLTGVETRTSSPIRIKRGDDYQSINTRGLYPAGEGAGYAGGILSAGVDGIKVAEAVARAMMQA